MLILQGVTYIHPNRDLLFSDINLTINKHDKAALIGNNGVGKSTLLDILAGRLQPASGLVKTESLPYYVPQIFGQFDHYTIAQALGIEAKLSALRNILDGRLTEENLAILDDDWSVEERCREALALWHPGEQKLDKKMGSLSGGQKTRIFLAGIAIHKPAIVLLDEPSNHMDTAGRNLLYEYIRSTKNTLVLVTHDRTLLNLTETVYELNSRGITRYGGNYDFYTEQKNIEHEALNQDLKEKEKALRKAKEIRKEALDRKQKLDARGKKKQEKAGLPTISMNTLKNNAEKSTSRIKSVHSEKIGAIGEDLTRLRSVLPDNSKMKIDFDGSLLHQGKMLIRAKDINFGYGTGLLWKQGLHFRINSGERITIEGANGSGKTTLIKMLLGKLIPVSGTIETGAINAIYIDQDYSLINNELSVYEHAQEYNSGALQEHEIKIRLNRFLFTRDFWNKSCGVLSGGEKMRLMLCSWTIANQVPDLIVLDEPTNNLDIQSAEILTAAINGYQGTVLVVSHDEYFLKQIGVGRSIDLDSHAKESSDSTTTIRRLQ